MTATIPDNPNVPAFLAGWSFEPESSGDAVSFGVSAAPTQAAGPTWRLDLPPGGAAAAALDAAEDRLRRAEEALQAVPDELDALLLAARTGAVAFNAALSPATAELLDLLDTSRASPEMTSFSLFSGKQEKLIAAGRGFQDALQRLSDMVSRMANVETSVKGSLVGRTRVSWSGDFESVYPIMISPQDLKLHQRSLNLALTSRRLAVSMIARTIQGAVKVSALLAMPGGVLLALPSVWKFINAAISEISTYQESRA
jgi:hypothetical protein